MLITFDIDRFIGKHISVHLGSGHSFYGVLLKDSGGYYIHSYETGTLTYFVESSIVAMGVINAKNDN